MLIFDKTFEIRMHCLLRVASGAVSNMPKDSGTASAATKYLRNMNAEAIDCYKTVLENFSDTALAPKARAALLELGVEVTAPVVTEDSEVDEGV